MYVKENEWECVCQIHRLIEFGFYERHIAFMKSHHFRWKFINHIYVRHYTKTAIWWPVWKNRMMTKIYDFMSWFIHFNSILFSFYHIEFYINRNLKTCHSIKMSIKSILSALLHRILQKRLKQSLEVAI